MFPNIYSSFYLSSNKLLVKHIKAFKEERAGTNEAMYLMGIICT